MEEFARKKKHNIASFLMNIIMTHDLLRNVHTEPYEFCKYAI